MLKRCGLGILMVCWSILLFLPSEAAEPPTLKWQKTAGLEWDDEGWWISPTEDEGYIVVGWTEPTGDDKDVFLIKLNKAGDIEWERNLGGDKDDVGYYVCQASDGGYLVVGKTKSWGAGCFDLYIIKTDSTGKERWHRVFGGKKNDGPAGFGALQETPDGGYLVAGYTWSYGRKEDIWLVKLNSFGNIVWYKIIGGKETDWARSIIKCHDGNFIIVGKTVSSGAGRGDVYVVKVDADGNILWEKTFGGSESDWANSILEIPDGGYLIVGGTRSYGNGESDTYMVRLDAEGNKLWERTFPESEGADWGLTIRQAQHGGFLISLTLWRCCTGYDAELLRIDSEGKPLWKVDGGYIGVGETESYGSGGTDVYLVKLGPGL